jgi:hypothetical protein
LRRSQGKWGAHKTSFIVFAVAFLVRRGKRGSWRIVNNFIGRRVIGGELKGRNIMKREYGCFKRRRKQRVLTD